MKMVKKLLGVAGLVVESLLLVFLFTLLIQVGMMLFFEFSGCVISEDVMYALSANIGAAFAGIVIVLQNRKKGYQVAANERTGFCFKKALFYGVLAVCICHILYSVVTTILFSRMFPIVPEVSRVEGFWLNLVGGVIIAPIGEEMLFRVGLYTYMREKFNRISALIVCTLIFSTMHLYNLLGFFSCVLAGIVFTVIYEKTGNAWYGIVAHGFCNLNALIMNSLERNGVNLFGMPLQYEVNGYNMYHVLVIIPAFGFLLWAAWRKYAKKMTDNKILIEER